MGTPRLLFLSAPATAFADLCVFLRHQSFQVFSIAIDTENNAIVNALEQIRPDLVIVEEVSTISHRALDVATEIRRARPALPIIFATRQGSEPLAIAVFRAGLQDYVRLPIAPPDFLERVNSHLEKTMAAPGCASPNPPKCDRTRMIGMSGRLQETKEYLVRAAQSNCTILVTGETGTGKELAARLVHETSSRRDKPFVCVNCAAIPDSLLESELFGHIRGAFTDARETHDGLLRAADGGTIFLDEIGDMSQFAQAKILRVLDTKEVCRLGETRRVHLDLRFVAATNQDLLAMTAQKTFRQDLFFRLDVAHVHLPPLRERRDDITLLVREFCKEFAPMATQEMPEFSEDFLNALLDYDWPGNIRELKNLIESLFLRQLPHKVGAEHLPMHLRRCLEKPERLGDERSRLLSVLLATKWNKTKAAQTLNWSRMTLYRKIEKYNIVNQSPETKTGRNAF
jgi:DNA-binding NtrC family response regulator